MKTARLLTALGLGAMATTASAQLVTITDTTLGTSTRNGTLGATEYGNLSFFSTGIGSGFGNILGSNSRIYFDSSYSTGALNLGVQLGGGSLFDAGVIYIDSVSGGLGGTSTIEDTSDGGRRAISGDGGGNQSELTFASGFLADYAITLQDSFSGLFKIEGSGALTFVATLNLTPTGTPALQQREGELLLSQIGLVAGDSFRYVATYLNPNDAFRSNELHGHGGTVGSNIGQNPFTFDNFNVFVSVPEPTSMALLGLGLAGLLIFRRRA